MRLVRDGLAKTWTGILSAERRRPVDGSRGGHRRGDDTPIINDPRVGLYARTPTSTMTASFDNFDITVPDQRPVYGPEIGLDVKASMQDKNGSIYMRMPVHVQRRSRATWTNWL